MPQRDSRGIARSLEGLNHPEPVPQLQDLPRALLRAHWAIMQKSKKASATKPSGQQRSSGIRLDLNLARKLMSEAVSMAGTEQARKAHDYPLWRDKILAFSELVNEVGYRASIALLGSALVAKATNNGINP